MKIATISSFLKLILSLGNIKQISKKLLLKTKDKSYTVKPYQYIRTMRITLCINILIAKIYMTQETKTTVISL